jgi:hypothetical protein
MARGERAGTAGVVVMGATTKTSAPAETEALRDSNCNHGNHTPDEIEIPNPRLQLGEADLRFLMNTLSRERPHWWLLTTAGRQQREFLEQLGWWAA